MVWSLIFLSFGVRMVNAEEQGSQVQQVIEKKTFTKFTKSTSNGRGYLTGGLMNGKEMRKPFLIDKKKRKKARVRTPRTLKKTAAKVRTSVLLKQTARERTRDPLKNQFKGGGFRRIGRRRSGRIRRGKGKRKRRQM